MVICICMHPEDQVRVISLFTEARIHKSHRLLGKYDLCPAAQTTWRRCQQIYVQIAPELMAGKVNQQLQLPTSPTITFIYLRWVNNIVCMPDTILPKYKLHSKLLHDKRLSDEQWIFFSGMFSKTWESNNSAANLWKSMIHNHSKWRSILEGNELGGCTNPVYVTGGTPYQLMSMASLPLRIGGQRVPSEFGHSTFWQDLTGVNYSLNV